MIVLDTTVRDGSYVVNFQYRRRCPQDCRGISTQSGIPYIGNWSQSLSECRGAGPGGSRDEEYFRAALIGGSETRET